MKDPIVWFVKALYPLHQECGTWVQNDIHIKHLLSSHVYFPKWPFLLEWRICGVIMGSGAIMVKGCLLRKMQEKTSRTSTPSRFLNVILDIL